MNKLKKETILNILLIFILLVIIWEIIALFTLKIDRSIIEKQFETHWNNSNKMFDLSIEYYTNFTILRNSECCKQLTDSLYEKSEYYKILEKEMKNAVMQTKKNK